MRVTTALNRMLGLPGAWVRDVEFSERAVIVTVVLRARKPVCSGCGTLGAWVSNTQSRLTTLWEPFCGHPSDRR